MLAPVTHERDRGSLFVSPCRKPMDGAHGRHGGVDR